MENAAARSGDDAAGATESTDDAAQYEADAALEEADMGRLIFTSLYFESLSAYRPLLFGNPFPFSHPSSHPQHLLICISLAH
jgi:hypothetical protein